jgi:ABC-2 type transport system ATP-binding protein|tara:strand:+ start:3095 stop:4006 length:912 start_codon:yes stop_codon:yes gene_type:complete
MSAPRYSLEIEGVSKYFGDKVAVRNLSANIPTGSIYGFLGPNGAGKTTTIRMIMDILHPDNGSISLFGGLTPANCKDRLGYLPEEKGLYKKMRTGELVTYFGLLKGLSRADAKRKAIASLEKFGLGHVINSRCDTLSKGMGQKVQIIATLLHGPDLVILDEPFSGLDPINVEIVRNIILELKQSGNTVIFSTHVMEQAEQICDYIMLINKGEKILDGTLEKIKQSSHETIQIEYEGDNACPKELIGVSRVHDMGKMAELSLNEGADPHQILQSLMGRIKIRSFQVKQPSLHEIFVRQIGSSAE